MDVAGLTVVGVDIGGTQCSVNLATLHGGEVNLVHREQFATQAARGPSVILAEVADRLSAAVASADGTGVSAIGVSCGGPLDSEKGIIQSPPNLPGWDDVDIVGQIEVGFGSPCWLENDANACALAEWRLGAGRGAHHIIYLTFGTGLGAGMILGGELYRGASGLAGEVGHCRIGLASGPAKYGKAGSFEGFCSGAGISAWYQHWGGDLVPAQTVAERARAGEDLARQVFDQASRQLGHGVAILVDSLAPQVVVIGGIFGYANDLLRPGMEKVLGEEVHPRILSVCKVVPAELGQRIGSYASCCVAFEHLGAAPKTTRLGGDRPFGRSPVGGRDEC